MQSWELIVSPTESYLYTGLTPKDPEAKYVEVVPKDLLIRALLVVAKAKNVVAPQASLAEISEDPYKFNQLLQECNEVLDGFDRNKVYRKYPHYDDIPWHDVSKWTPGHWYPLPIGSNWTDSLLYVVEGYDLFYQDPVAPEDCLPVGTPTMTFQQACETCEFHNKEPLPGLR